MAKGIDYSDYRPSMAALNADGITFVCRYLFPASMGVKGLTLAEAQTISNAGISIVCNYENYPDGMLGGAAQGKTDANIVLTQLSSCQVPANMSPLRPVYFSADWQEAPSQTSSILAYLTAAAGVLRPNGYDVGVYGDYDVVKAVLDAGFKWAWQTLGWSSGRWDPRAQIRQVAVDSYNGSNADTDTSMTVDFGQWTLGGDMPTVLELWETPISITGVGSYAPINLLVELYLRSAGRGVLNQAAQNIQAVLSEEKVASGTIGADVDDIEAKISTLSSSAQVTIDYAKLADVMMSEDMMDSLAERIAVKLKKKG